MPFFKYNKHMNTNDNKAINNNQKTFSEDKNDDKLNNVIDIDETNERITDDSEHLNKVVVHPKFTLVSNVNEDQIEINKQQIEANELAIKLFEKKYGKKFHKLDKKINSSRSNDDKQEYQEKKDELLSKLNSKTNTYKAEIDSLNAFNSKNELKVESHLHRFKLFEQLLNDKEVDFVHSSDSLIDVHYLSTVQKTKKEIMSLKSVKANIAFLPGSFAISSDIFKSEIKFENIDNVCIYFFPNYIIVDFNRSYQKLNSLNGKKAHGKYGPLFFMAFKNTNDALSFVSRLKTDL